MDTPSDQAEPLRFKPLSDGLGLNHFADGLPYSPAASKARRPQNGGVAFNFPSSRQQQQQASALPTNHTRTATALEQAEAEFDAGESTPANMLSRILSFSLDALIALGIFVTIVWASFAINGFSARDLLLTRAGLQFAGPILLLYAVIHTGYFLIQEITWRKTIGKALFGIRIQSNSGFSILGRVVCFFVAVMPLGIGLLWYFFDHKHRCWHDVITDSEVVLG